MGTDRKVRVVVISAVHQRWTHLEWVCQELCRERFEVSFILISIPATEPYMAGFLAARGIPFVSLHCPLTPIGLARTWWRIYRLCRRLRPDVVHTHILLASLLGTVAAFVARVPVRINTRHHVRLRHVVVEHSWTIAWLDRLSSALSTRIIATSVMLREVLVEQEKLPAHKVALVPLGIDLEKFRHPDRGEVAALAGRYNPRRAAPVIGVVARHYKLKGIQHVIPAFQRLLVAYPSAYLVLASAYGPYHEILMRQLRQLPPERYVLIPFEPNSFALYQLFDLLVHVPVGPREESFGLVYLEALAAGVPSIFTLSGVAPEILEHRRNAWVVDHRDSDQIYEGMLALLADPELRRRLGCEGQRSLEPRFTAPVMQRAVEAVYLEALAEARQGRRSGS